MFLFYRIYIYSDDALYTLIYLYVSSKIMDLVVTGLSKRRVVYIISDKWTELITVIREELHKGITVLDGTRAGSAGLRKCFIQLRLLKRR